MSVTSGWRLSVNIAASLRNDFFEIYNAMQEMGIMVSINSNGSLLEGEVRARLLENPPFRLNVSLYGGCRETYRNMCGQDAFERITENLRALKAAGVDMRLNLSITPYNRQDVKRIYDISRELDVHIKASSYMYPPIRVNGGKAGCGNRLMAEEAAVSTLEWEKLRLTAEQFALRAENMSKLIAPESRECAADPECGISCRAGSSSFWMTWDGRMLPCGMMPGPAAYPLKVGFDQAWEQLREMTREIRMPAKCMRCDKRDVCLVCAAVCVTETGSFDGVPEYVCRQTEEMIRLTREAYQERIKNGN
jgi:radical SAM protein with 4Fe4S-binding SPASM domain